MGPEPSGVCDPALLYQGNEVGVGDFDLGSDSGKQDKKGPDPGLGK